MSKEELSRYQDILNKSLEESYKKMIRLKMKLGQDIVTSDENGNPVILSAEEAFRQYQSSVPSNTTC